MVRAYDCVCAVGRLAVSCPPPAATALLGIEFQPSALYATLDKLVKLVINDAREVAAQVRGARKSLAAVCVCMH